MSGQRFATMFLSLVCIGLTWGVRHKNDVPIGGPAAAQAGEFLDSAGIGLVPADAATRRAVAAAITAQLDAFQKSDYNQAIQYQSSGFRRHFKTTGQFRAMMMAAYPEFVHYQSIHFGNATADRSAQHVVMRITLTGRDGATVHAAYDMIKENNRYRIDGVAGGERRPQIMTCDNASG